jgi:hypothetical protein
MLVTKVGSWIVRKTDHKQDRESVNKMLAPFPNADKLRRLITRGETWGFCPHYDARTKTAYYVYGDERQVERFMITDICLREAMKVATQCALMPTWSLRSFLNAWQRAGKAGKLSAAA